MMQTLEFTYSCVLTSLPSFSPFEEKQKKEKKSD